MGVRVRSGVPAGAGLAPREGVQRSGKIHRMVEETRCGVTSGEKATCPACRATSVGRRLIAWEMDARTRRFTRVSGSAEAVLGYPVERWRSVPGFWIGVLHPEDRERVAAAVWRVLRNRQACEIEYRAVASDGGVVRLRDRVRVVSDPAGAGLRLQGTMMELTARPPAPSPEPGRPQRWRRGRYGGRAVFAPPVPPSAPHAPPPVLPREPGPPVVAFPADRLLHAVGEAVVVSDAEHRIVYWNPAAEALLGWPAAEALGKLDSDILRARLDSGQTAEIVAGLIGRRPWSAEVLVQAHDDETVPVRITASALRQEGDVAGYVAVITDLRSVRRGESRRSAAAAMDAVSRLARGVAEELSDGVARIETAVRHALARVTPGEASRRHLDDALRTVDATAALASQLLAMGRALKIQPAPAQLAEIVRRGLPAIRLLAPEHVDVETRLDVGLTAQVDPVVANQILLNLAANCCGAMPEGGRLVISTSAVELTGTRPGEPVGVEAGPYVLLEVADTRKPIPPDALDRIFEPFHEEAAPPGMALAAAHGLAVASGGTIDVRSGDDGGLVFRVYMRSADTARV